MMKPITEKDFKDMTDELTVMGAYKKTETVKMTIWVPVEQEPLPLPAKATPKLSAPFAKRIGKKYGERKNWW